jgi:hypothetical protein
LLRKLASAVAAAGVVLAFVAIWVGNLPGESYWSTDGTTGAFCLLLAALSALLFVAGIADRSNGPMAALGALMLGYFVFTPALLGYDSWDQAEAGLWLAVAAGALIVIGAGGPYLVDAPKSTPPRLSRATLTAALGIVLVFPGLFLDFAQGGRSYWDVRGEIGIVILVVAIASALAWAATVAGVRTRGLDQALTLALFGLVLFVPVQFAWDHFGSLDSGAWLALAGGILAAGGTWAARDLDVPSRAASSAQSS